jgi:alpha-tubulin suppressor-like RCC1 family protein
LALSVGDYGNCALIGGGLRCWGDNVYGALGTGSTSATLVTPEQVAGLGSGVAASAVGLSHACALMTTGNVKCWGLNLSGQVGDGTQTDRFTPVDVVGLTGAVSIALGSEHSCAVLADGSVRCWGENFAGELGDGTTVGRSAPVPVLGVTDAQGLALGDSFSCALLHSGQVICWGANEYGQLGDGTTAPQQGPVAVAL